MLSRAEKKWITSIPSRQCAKSKFFFSKKSVVPQKGYTIKNTSQSRDIHSIENFFHQVKKELRRQALQQNIMHETFEEFSTRIITTMKEFPSHLIDCIIDSMAGHMDSIIQGKGERTKC